MSCRVDKIDKMSVLSGYVSLKTKKPFQCLITYWAKHLQHWPVCLSTHRITSSVLFGKLLFLDQFMFLLFSFVFGQEMYQIYSPFDGHLSFYPFYGSLIFLYTRILRTASFCKNKALSPHSVLINEFPILYLQKCFLSRNQ